MRDNPFFNVQIKLAESYRAKHGGAILISAEIQLFARTVAVIHLILLIKSENFMKIDGKVPSREDAYFWLLETPRRHKKPTLFDRCVICMCSHLNYIWCLEEKIVTIKSLAVASISALGIALIALPAIALTANMKLLDPDSDGTVSLAEAQAAGAKKFESLDPDHDGTLDSKEAKPVLMDSTIADPDKDGTVDKAEYAAQVEKAFKKADLDGDGTLDKAELTTPAGQEFLILVQ